MNPKIYPVIHYLDEQVTTQEVQKARLFGADGCFLISHKANDRELLEVGFALKELNPDFPIGINCLTFDSMEAVRVAKGLGFPMVWADSVGVTSKGVTGAAEMVSKIMRQNSDQHLEVFAGVAFKYQPLESNPTLAARNAISMGFIPTTSGAGTGSAPEHQKIIDMSTATNGVLAVASGMTPENVAGYARYLSHILVSTGISEDEYRIDVDKLQRLIANSKSPALN